MDARANMRAMLESARQSIRSRAANTTGRPAPKKVATIASSTSAHTHKKPAESAPADGVEALHFTKDTTSGADGADADAAATALTAKDNRMQFVQHYYRLLTAFIEDKSKYELELPNLSALDRVVVHALAEKCNLSHESAGTRSDRVMHLKKDILFFQHPEAAQQVNLEEVIEKVSWKESKYQIRYVRSANPAQVAVGDIGSYGDEDALQKIERFRRATDEYRHATEMGYTQQELLMAETGEQEKAEGEEGYAAPANVEEILSRTDTSALAITAGPSASPTSASAAIPAPAPSTAARAMKATAAAAPSPASLAASSAQSKATKAAPKAAAAAAPAATSTAVVFDEVCRACGTRVRLDGPPQGWKCSHYCLHCTRQTIWSLEEVRVQETRAAAREEAGAMKRGRDGAEGEAEELRRKGVRGESPAEVEEIDREDDEGGDAHHSSSGDGAADGSGAAEEEEEDAEEDGLTVEDMMEVAATNDFSAKDVNWLRGFASHTVGNPGRQIAFCIDFADLPDMPIFTRYRPGTAATPDGTTTAEPWYVVLREVRELSLAVSDLLRELLTEALAPPSAMTPAVEEIQTDDAEERAMEHVAVAFPNLSVYGTECVVVAQLRPLVRRAAVPHMTIKTEALRQLRQRYGERHVFASQSLQDAVAYASGSSSA